MPADTPTERSDPRERRKYYLETTLLRRILTPTLRILFRFISVIQTSGVENLPSEGPVVLAANHMSFFDMFPMQFALPRPIFFMAKAELHRSPILDAVLRPLGSFPVERGSHDEWAFRHAQRLLEHGQVLGIFPEGTRSRGLGLRSAKTGAARLAIVMSCPLVPMAVEGTQRMFHGFPHRSTVQIKVGEPIYPQHGETALALTDRMMFTLAGLLPPELRGVYAQRPLGF